ncbi:MAG: hypothetical protein K2O45_07080 [Oscillospiraceae bacterium]|nr:hypothetical protein [Oscillospiraceae bacterium]
MDIQRINTYDDPRFPQEVLYQHGAFLVDGRPWAFRVISGHEAVVRAEDLNEAALAEAAEDFRFYAEHITTFYDETGKCLLRLPPVERREVEIDSLQPSQFSVDREKCAAVGHFIHTAADIVVPVAALEDGSMCVMDGHTRLYEAWRRGIRTAMVFDAPGWKELANFVAEARRRNIRHVRDMALYSPQQQKENWHDWCDAYFAAKNRTEEE